MAQSLSDDEFHRMQVQLLEIRTENYRLKDETKKQANIIRDLTDKQVGLDKELNKQIKMKKALSTLNKSKQAQEYEALLQQTEQEFALQNQTLMQEISKMSVDIGKLEKENRILKSEAGNGGVNSINESDFRRLQAENTALKSKIENLNVAHDKEMRQVSSNQQAAQADVTLPSSSLDETNGAEATEQNDNADQREAVVKHPLSLSNDTPDLNNEDLIRAEAQCARLREQLEILKDIQVKFETEREEKRLLGNDLDECRKRDAEERKALADEIDSFRSKVDAKQAVVTQLQDEKERLFSDSKLKSDEIELLKRQLVESVRQEQEKCNGETASLGKALQSSNEVVEKQQIAIESFQLQIKQLEQEKTELIAERESLLQQRNDTQRALSRMAIADQQIAQLQSRIEHAIMERDDAIVKFEENARASGALLQRVDQVEQENESVRRELTEAKQLAEKRKKVMDKQAVESQEHNARFTEQIQALQSDSESRLKQSIESYEEKVQALEHTCKRQEQELIRVHHQDRVKTRELDTYQQQVRDLEASVTSLDNSRGWFERALQDAEKVAEERKLEHQAELEQAEANMHKELDKMRQQLSLKDDDRAAVEQREAEAKDEIASRDLTIDRLKQDVKDEVSRQKLVEKKGLSALKDLKRQLVNERKTNEKLQEKLKEISSNNSNLDELLETMADGGRANGGGDDGSSVSSFSFRDIMSPNKNTRQHTASGSINDGSVNSAQNQASAIGSSQLSPVPTPNVTKAESQDLLHRITTLQQEKWSLEEQVRHLEESAGAMAEELLEKTKLMQQYVQHQRTDVHRTRASNEELGTRRFGDRVRSMITGQEETDIANMRELNRKLTRMLEEEMTKNIVLKEDLVNLTNQLPSTSKR